MTSKTQICLECGQIINKDYEEFDKGNVRIYKWEDKPVKDFQIPKGFRMIEEREFIDLYDNDKIELEKYHVIYFTKNRSKKNIKNGWGLSRLYLNRGLDLVSYYDDLADSDDDGRVVVVKC